jgi:hypothetical protein
MSQEWSDLAKVWHAEAAAISADEIEDFLRRERVRLRGARIAELAGLGLGLGIALWMAMTTTVVYFAGLFGLFCAVTLWLTARYPGLPPARGGEDLLTSLEASIGYEDWLLSQLRIGRAFAYLPLFASVYLASDQLRHFANTDPRSLVANALCVLVMLVVLGWNLLLTRRARRRKARLEGFLGAMT